MDCSIVVVSYNTKELLRNCLRSVLDSRTGYPYEVCVVDNGSSDGSADMVEKEFHGVRLFRNPINGGFAQANNLALRQCTARYALLLNPDTVVLPETLDIMLRVMDEHLRVGAAGCKVVKGDGALDLACRRSFPTPANAFYHAIGLAKLFPRSPRFAGYNLTYLDENDSYPVDCLVGAFMMVRQEVLQTVGLLDERFFMYGEDIDWCYRIKRAGWEVYYSAETSIIHYKGESSKKQSYRMIREFYRAMDLYYVKHEAERRTPVLNTIVRGGIRALLGLALLRNAFRKDKRVS